MWGRLEVGAVRGWWAGMRCLRSAVLWRRDGGPVQVVDVPARVVVPVVEVGGRMPVSGRLSWRGCWGGGGSGRLICRRVRWWCRCCSGWPRRSMCFWC